MVAIVMLRSLASSKIIRLALGAGAALSLVQCTSDPGQSMVNQGASNQGASSSGGAQSGGGTTSGVGGSLVINVAGTTGTGGGSEDTGPCEGLECQQTTCTLGNCTMPACAANAPLTTVSGKVFDPAGKVPLYNVVVYVPNGPVPAFTDGAVCDRCDASIANPVASAITDTQGAFKLEDVPVGSDIPLVIQVGKWRRQIVVPAVTACVDTPLTDPNVTRLPRNQMEGDIPQIAITTGGADSMECLPRRMGIDDAEFTTEAGTGRIHLYSGADSGQSTATKAFASTLNAGATLTRSTQLWNDKAMLKKYDIVIFSCEGATIEAEKPPADRQAVYDYVSEGGRLFASHWHHIWFSEGPAPVPSIATWRDREDPQNPAIGMINTTFPKGAAFADWLVNVGASQTSGQLSIIEARDNMQLVDETKATRWITVDANEECVPGCQNDDDLSDAERDACVADCNANPSAVEYMSFNAPLDVPEEQKCGRAVYNDVHVSATGADQPGDPFPDSCEVRDLSNQEKAVMFMLFDLSACVMNDKDPPRPPVVF
jgi:hypothetical protein